MIRKKSTNIEKDNRIKQILNMLGQGLLPSQITDKLSCEWQCSKRNVQRYMRIISDQTKIHQKENFETLLHQLFIELKSKNDKSYLKILELIAKQKPQETKLDITSGGQPITINFLEHKPEN